MREIKFEAFYKPLGVMLDDVTIYPDGQIGYSLEDFTSLIDYDNLEGDIDDLDGVEVGDDWIWIDFAFLGIRQYTGLKDKNGVEIYEGDLIINSLWQSEDKTPLEVSFGWGDDNERWGTSYGILFGSTVVGNDENSNWIVVGNKYEHPNLLKDEQEGGK